MKQHLPNEETSPDKSTMMWVLRLDYLGDVLALFVTSFCLGFSYIAISAIPVQCNASGVDIACTLCGD